MKLWKSIAGKSLRKAARFKLINRIVTYIYESGKSELPDSTSRDMGKFTDSRGIDHELVHGLRDWLKPDWRSMFEDQSVESLEASPVSGRSALTARCSVEDALTFLQTLGYSIEGTKTLEIGCFDGLRSFALASLGADSVMATDIPDYYLNQQEGTQLLPEELEKGRRDQLSRFHSGAETFERVHKLSGLLQSVTFLEDDICDSSLPADTFDFVFSWEVLEHVQQPEYLFQTLARILRPGQTAFHEYNPFFSITGGHSLCTLDFLWGHARLSEEDFSSYIRKIRPDETEVAIRFFTRNLNRMSYADLRYYVQKSGLELVALIPWYNQYDNNHVNRDILSQVQAHYPSVTVEDLLARNVWVVLSRPV